MKEKQLNPDHLLHQQVAQLLSAYLDSQVDARERHLVEQHLSSCATCRHDLESLRRTVCLLRQLPAAVPLHPFTLRAERVVPERPLVWRWLFGIPGLATGLATLMCVVALAGVLLYNRLARHGYVMPLARAPVTYSIPVTPTAVSIPEAEGTATQTAALPMPAVAHDELGLPSETPVPTSTPSQLIGPPTALATSPPETTGRDYLPPSPTPFATQSGQEGLAISQPSPQWSEATGEAHIEEEISGQRYEGTMSPAPSPAVGVMAVPPATETPVIPTAQPTEAPAVPEAPMPSTEEATLPPAPSPAVEVMAVPPATETPVIPTAQPTEAPAAPPSAEETPTLVIEETAPTTPTVVVEGAQETPSVSPTEPTPTPTRIPIPVRDLRMTIKPGLIHIEGALPLPPGQLIQAELWREGQLMKWAIPETQRGKVQEEGRFELELKAQPDQPGFDLFQLTPAHYEVRIVPLDFEAPVEARIPFDTFPPKTEQP